MDGHARTWPLWIEIETDRAAAPTGMTWRTATECMVVKVYHAQMIFDGYAPGSC
ncbi:MAG: hypothetical protein ACLTBV_13815 [Enterocloster bolteae]